MLLDGQILSYIDHHYLHEQISIVSQVHGDAAATSGHPVSSLQ